VEFRGHQEVEIVLGRELAAAANANGSRVLEPKDSELTGCLEGNLPPRWEKEKLRENNRRGLERGSDLVRSQKSVNRTLKLCEEKFYYKPLQSPLRQ